MSTITKQKILDLLNEIETINKKLKENIEDLNKIAPNTFFENTTSETLKTLTKNQQKINELMELMSKLLMKI